MKRFETLAGARRGGVLVEFALSATLTLFMLISSVEFGIEIFTRQASAFAADVAVQTYAETKSMAQAGEAMRAAVPGFVAVCLQDPEIRLVNTLASKDLLSSGFGRAAKDNPSDNGATIARIFIVCERPRLTPALVAVLGPRMRQEYLVFTGIRA